MKRLSLPIVLGLVLLFVGCLPKPQYEETQFLVSSAKEFHYINISVERNNVIEGSWKSTQSLYVWQVSPSGGETYPGSDTRITPPPWEGKSGDVVRMAGMTGRTFSTKVTQTGYYTFCFMKMNEKDATSTVVFRYRVR